jgi:hypothetical protein
LLIIDLMRERVRQDDAEKVEDFELCSLCGYADGNLAPKDFDTFEDVVDVDETDDGQTIVLEDSGDDDVDEVRMQVCKRAHFFSFIFPRARNKSIPKKFLASFFFVILIVDLVMYSRVFSVLFATQKV